MVRLQVEDKLRHQRASCEIFGVSFGQGSIMIGVVMWRGDPLTDPAGGSFNVEEEVLSQPNPRGA
ncbi:hypothetical protein PpBr36_04372 [Pyricularia pennisetigena]|uniref:hypothetical protein n=1 Tax=Pyricularia pennisetigena TaxID=1578925 RepID=UPI00114E68B9|nr:hypothetical protein PpBr36_04372 [Pyricularia pennisetigena]TLS27501.1 hypothetical protein PpBr36_04372 [Pyricularia pennisetigena]